MFLTLFKKKRNLFKSKEKVAKFAPIIIQTKFAV